MFLDCGKKYPHRAEENMQTPQRKKAVWLADSNPGASHYEAAVLITAPAKSRSDCKMNLLLL